MTVGELIKELSKYQEDEKVVLSNYERDIFGVRKCIYTFVDGRYEKVDSFVVIE